MPFFSRDPHLPKAGATASEGQSPGKADSLPALLRERDLALIIILITIIVPDMRGMQFAGTAVFFYWFLAIVAFQLPSIWVLGWLTRQAPRHVPFYVWILRFVHERLRSMLLYLMWWTGVLIVLTTLGMCLSLLQVLFPSWLSAFPAQCLVFAVLLLLATLLLSLPLRLFRIALWIGGLLYLTFFAFVGVTALVALLRGHRGAFVVAPPTFTVLPAQFSWSLFGLALLSLFGLNGPLLLDGEIQGTRHFRHRSTSYLWWGGLGSVLILLLVGVSSIVLDPTLQMKQELLFQLVGSVLGPGVVSLAWLLLLLGTFGCVLAYLFVFSRAFLLAARQGYLPRSFAQLNRWGIPMRAILTQSTIIVGAAVLLFVAAPALLRASLPATLLKEVITGNQFALFTSLAGSLWCSLTALLFGFALWLFWKKRHHTQENWGQRLVLPVLCLSGGLSSLVCALSPLLPEWPSLFFSRDRWFPLVLLGVIYSLALAWMIGELPRGSALVRAKASSLAREKELHEKLQRAYGELDRLYQQQEQAALTDGVTELFNHRAFMQRLDEAIVRSQTEASSFLLVFLDLDHFKAINDTWGHLAGDAVLHEVAERLRGALHPGDVAARYGGEEFALIMDGATRASACEAGERLRQVIQSPPCSYPGVGETKNGINVTASIGVAAYSTHSTQRDHLIEQADQAMYQAKLDGRNCVRVAST